MSMPTVSPTLSMKPSRLALQRPEISVELLPPLSSLPLSFQSCKFFLQLCTLALSTTSLAQPSISTFLFITGIQSPKKFQYSTKQYRICWDFEPCHVISRHVTHAAVLYDYERVSKQLGVIASKHSLVRGMIDKHGISSCEIGCIGEYVKTSSVGINRTACAVVC